MVLPISVLLVEDDAGDARLLRSTLAGSGAGRHEIEHVTSLAAAKSRLGRHPLPDIVLLDLSLSDSSGQATFDGLFQDNGHVPVVVLTGLDDDTVATTAVESGAQDYLVKGSVTGDVMARAIRHAIERHQLQSALRERVKEQAGLVAISRTLQSDLPMLQRCVEIADHLTAAMQFPKVCHASVTIDATSGTAGQDPSADGPALMAAIMVDGAARGQLVVTYSDPALEFLIPEEQILLESAADAIGGWLARQDSLRQLVREEERLRVLVSQLPGMVWTTDRQLRITSAAGAALIALGIDGREMVGVPIVDLLEADPGRETLAMFNMALGGESVEFERTWLQRWWRNWVEPMIDSNGRIVGTVCLTMDITTERRQSSDLDVATQRFRGLFANTLDAMILADDDGTYIDANPAASSLTGYEHDELVGMTVTQLTPVAHRVTADVAMAMWQQFLEDGAMGGDFPIRRNDGTVVETEFRAVANIVPGVHLSTMRDITDRKRAEEALTTSEARFRNIAESSQDIIYQVRLYPEVSFEYVSPALEMVTGFPPQALYENPSLYLDRLLPETGDPVAQVAATPDAVPTFVRLQFRHADGHWIWLEDHHTVLTEGGRPVAILGMIRDVTSREHVERALRDALEAEREAAERLRAIDGIKSSFLQAVSHELRTPLTSVLGYAHTLMSGRLTSEQSDEFHRRLLTNAKRLDVLLSDLLDVDRLNRGIVRLSLQATDLAALAASVAASVDLTDRNLILEDAPTIGLVDAPQVERIVRNLIGNAAKHTLPGSTIWVSFQTADDSVTIIVADDGPGIAEDDLERVFEPFWQTPAMGSTASPGTGIGLALVRQLATLHGGRAWAEPRDGGGASFHISLPSPTADVPATSRRMIFRTAEDDAGVARFRELMQDTVDQLHASSHPDEVAGLLLTWIHQVGGQVTMPETGSPDVLDIDLSLGTPQPLRAAAPPGTSARKRLDNHLPFLLLAARRTIAEQTDIFDVTNDDIDPETGVLSPQALGRVLDHLHGHDVIAVLTIEPELDAGPAGSSTPARRLMDLVTRLSRAGDRVMLVSQGELVLVLPDTPLDRAETVLDRIHEAWGAGPEYSGSIASAVAPVTSGDAHGALDQARDELTANGARSASESP